jgi:hypothetical protein
MNLNENNTIFRNTRFLKNNFTSCHTAINNFIWQCIAFLESYEICDSVMELLFLLLRFKSKIKVFQIFFNKNDVNRSRIILFTGSIEFD